MGHRNLKLKFVQFSRCEVYLEHLLFNNKAIKCGSKFLAISANEHELEEPFLRLGQVVVGLTDCAPAVGDGVTTCERDDLQVGWLPPNLETNLANVNSELGNIKQMVADLTSTVESSPRTKFFIDKVNEVIEAISRLDLAALGSDRALNERLTNLHLFLDQEFTKRNEVGANEGTVTALGSVVGDLLTQVDHLVADNVEMKGALAKYVEELEAVVQASPIFASVDSLVDIADTVSKVKNVAVDLKGELFLFSELCSAIRNTRFVDLSAEIERLPRIVASAEASVSAITRAPEEFSKFLVRSEVAYNNWVSNLTDVAKTLQQAAASEISISNEVVKVIEAASKITDKLNGSSSLALQVSTTLDGQLANLEKQTKVLFDLVDVLAKSLKVREAADAQERSWLEQANAREVRGEIVSVLGLAGGLAASAAAVSQAITRRKEGGF